jgi:hypothetical protein
LSKPCKGDTNRSAFEAGSTGPATASMIGEAQIRAMKPGAYLINNARGTVVDLDGVRITLSKPCKGDTNRSAFEAGSTGNTSTAAPRR